MCFCARTRIATLYYHDIVAGQMRPANARLYQRAEVSIIPKNSKFRTKLPNMTNLLHMSKTSKQSTFALAKVKYRHFFRERQIWYYTASGRLDRFSTTMPDRTTAYTSQTKNIIVVIKHIITSATHGIHLNLKR